MKEATVTLKNPSGLHARPAAQFTQAAAKFKTTTIKLSKEDKEVDAKSILALMSFGAACGSVLTIRATGDEEEAAVKTLAELVESGFGE
ncbi:MAG: HPr family phosphocarrier protein [Sporomusaceae bacterium]|nr:HPr family phosphocarrier protein [Sporomusaceae bacterium]